MPLGILRVVSRAETRGLRRGRGLLSAFRARNVVLVSGVPRDGPRGAQVAHAARGIRRADQRPDRNGGRVQIPSRRVPRALQARARVSYGALSRKRAKN